MPEPDGIAPAWGLGDEVGQGRPEVLRRGERQDRFTVNDGDGELARVAVFVDAPFDEELAGEGARRPVRGGAVVGDDAAEVVAEPGD